MGFMTDKKQFKERIDDMENQSEDIIQKKDGKSKERIIQTRKCQKRML